MDDVKKLIPMLIIPSIACLLCSGFSSFILATQGSEMSTHGNTLGVMIAGLLCVSTPIISGLIGLGTGIYLVFRKGYIADSRIDGVLFVLMIAVIFFLFSLVLIYIGDYFGGTRLF